MTCGTAHTEAVIFWLDKYGVPLVGPSSRARVLHQPVQKDIFNVRAIYQREAEKAASHMQSMGVTKIAVVYTDDSFGADGLAGTQKGMVTAKRAPVAVEKLSRSKPDFTTIAPQVYKAGAQTVIMIASSQVVVEGVKALRATGSAAQIVTLSNKASTGFIKRLSESGRGLMVTQVFPSECSIAFSLVKPAQELVKAQPQPELSPAMLEGFSAAKVLVESLRRAGPKPTREKIQAALEGLRKFDLGGLEVGYRLDDHTGLDFADLSIIGTDGRFRH